MVVGPQFFGKGGQYPKNLLGFLSPADIRHVLKFRKDPNGGVDEGGSIKATFVKQKPRHAAVVNKALIVTNGTNSSFLHHSSKIPDGKGVSLLIICQLSDDNFIVIVKIIIISSK